MEVQQPAISKLVRRPDMKVSILRDLIAAMGGELHITATFPDSSGEIASFTGHDLRPGEAGTARPGSDRSAITPGPCLGQEASRPRLQALAPLAAAIFGRTCAHRT